MTSREPLPALPDVAGADATVRGYEAMAALALVAPRGTASSIVARVSVALEAGTGSPEIRTRLKAPSVDLGQGRPEDVGRFPHADRIEWGGPYEFGIREP